MWNYKTYRCWYKKKQTNNQRYHFLKIFLQSKPLLLRIFYDQTLKHSSAVTKIWIWSKQKLNICLYDFVYVYKNDAISFLIIRYDLCLYSTWAESWRKLIFKFNRFEFNSFHRPVVTPRFKSLVSPTIYLGDNWKRIVGFSLSQEY